MEKGQGDKLIGANLDGKLLAKVRCAFYEFKGIVERDAGFIELSFAEGTCVHFGVGPDAESLSLNPGPWIDPLALPRSRENEEYVNSHGKYTAFDVSTQEPYTEILGRVVSRVQPIINEITSNQTGLLIDFGASCLKIEVIADELYVSYIAG
ncbi:hypothetical protein [Streptosporangium sp. NPDC002607]